MGIQNPNEDYGPVEKALKDLTYADKTGRIYFSLNAVRSEMSRDVPKTFLRVHSDLENLVSRGVANKIVGKIGPNEKVVRLYRYI